LLASLMRDRLSLFQLETRANPAVDLRDQVQMVLAVADAPLLRSLLTDCTPALALPQTLASVDAEVGVTAKSVAADGVLSFRSIQYMLAEKATTTELPASVSMLRSSRELARLVQHESELQTLQQKLPLAPTVALLEQSGFATQQIQEILHLPQDSWHKSWWYGMDKMGHFTLPFLRCIRILRYPDGTLTIQYKDYFEEEKPNCFANQEYRVLIASKQATENFSETLQRVNQQRAALGVSRAILIAMQLNPMEAEAFMRQGVSVYPLNHLLMPVQADCMRCDRRECPLWRVSDSPVAMCYGFLPTSEVLS